MGKQARQFALVVLLGWAGPTGCGKVIDPLPDKNTNWLKHCEDSAACGEGLQCLCGACTRACEATEDCLDAAPAASCHAVSAAAWQDRCKMHGVNESMAVCAADCSSDADCRRAVGADASCQGGICVRTARADEMPPESGPDPDQELDAAVPATADAAAFEAFVADHRDCETVSDCTLIMPGCPLGCYVAVSTESVVEAGQVATRARAERPSCRYRCASPPMLACENSNCTIVDEPRPGDFGQGWTKLSDPPLSGRSDPLMAAVEDTIIVAGGWDWLCPPGASCAGPTTPPHTDGAAFNVATGAWRTIADAPTGFRGPKVAVVGDDVYALGHCDLGPMCPAGKILLRYRSDADEWEILDGPASLTASSYRLAAVDGGIVAYHDSDEDGDEPDYRFLAVEDRWATLPEDPLPPVYDRFIVEHSGRLLLFGAPTDGTDTKLAAAYDPQTDAWVELAASGAQGYQVWRAGSLLYLNPHFGNAAGGIYDPSTDSWSPLPDPPYHDLAGIIGEDEATYEYPSGWVLDTREGSYLEIEPHANSEDVYGETVAGAPQMGLVVFGGQTWSSDEGELLSHVWVWTPPGPP